MANTDGDIITNEELQDGINLIWVAGYIFAGALVLGGIMILLPIVFQGNQSEQDDEEQYSCNEPLTISNSKNPERTNPPQSIYLDDVEQQRLAPQQESSPQQGITSQQELALQPQSFIQQEVASQQGLLTQQEVASQKLRKEKHVEPHLQNENNSTDKSRSKKEYEEEIDESTDKGELCSNRASSRNSGRNEWRRQNHSVENYSSNSSGDRRRRRNEESQLHGSNNHDRSTTRSHAHGESRSTKHDRSRQKYHAYDGNDRENNRMSASEASMNTSISTRKGEIEDQQNVEVDVVNSDSDTFQRYINDKEDDGTSFQVMSQVSKNPEDDNLSKSRIKKKYRDKIIPLLEKYFPQKVLSIDEMLKEFDGQEYLLYYAVKQKAESAETKATKYRDMLTQTLDIPVHEVDQVLKEWRGREDALIDSLQFLQDKGIMVGNEVMESKCKVGARKQNDKHISDTRSVQSVKEKINHIVQRDHPEWINDVDEMLLRFQGREHELFSALQIKAEAKRKEKEENQAVFYQAQIRKIIHESIPHMIDNIDEMLKEFSGNEKKLMDALIYKSQNIGENGKEETKPPLDGLVVICN